MFLELAVRLRAAGLPFARMVLVDAEDLSLLPSLEATPYWIHYAGSSTFGNIRATHEKHLRLLGLPEWPRHTPQLPAPNAQCLTTYDYPAPGTRAHTGTCSAAFGDPRVYEWLLLPGPRPGGRPKGRDLSPRRPVSAPTRA